MAITGGFRDELFGTRIASTDFRRPLLLALALLAAYVWQSSASTFVDDITSVTRPSARSVAAAASVAVFCLAILRGVTVAGSTDAYGYVSEAALWRHGTLVLPVESAERAPWPHPVRTLAPIGYRQSPTLRNHMVPTYAPGLPLAMALLQFVFGYSGAFLVVPLCGAAAVWLTFLLARRLFDSPRIGLASALLVATSPAFLFQLFWPMSDIPAATAWTTALVLLVYDQPLGAGIAMSAALAIRPNLVLLPALTLLWTAALDYRSRHLFGRTFRVALGLLPGIVGIAIIQWRLYGSPFESGYGPTGDIFAFRYAATNVSHYWSWLIETQTPLVLMGLVVFVARRWWTTQTPLPRLLFAGTLAATFASYLFYSSFEEWWYLRFLLPAWPLGMSLVIAGADGFLHRFVPRLRTAGLVLLVLTSAINGVRFAHAKGVFDLGRGERRYVDVARFVDQHTEPDAVVVALQHSGSIRQYAGRLTVRYDWLDPQWLDGCVAYFESIGRHPYLVLEGWEVEPFKHRFGGHSALASLDWPPLGRLQGWNDVVVYDLGATRLTTVRLEIPPLEILRPTGWPVPPPYPTQPR